MQCPLYLVSGQPSGLNGQTISGLFALASILCHMSTWGRHCSIVSSVPVDQNNRFWCWYLFNTKGLVLSPEDADAGYVRMQKY